MICCNLAFEDERRRLVAWLCSRPDVNVRPGLRCTRFLENKKVDSPTSDKIFCEKWLSDLARILTSEGNLACMVVRISATWTSNALNRSIMLARHDMQRKQESARTVFMVEQEP